MSLPRESLLVVATLEPVEPGVIFEKGVKLPPHMTLLPWFELLENQTHRFSLTLTRLAGRYSPLQIKGGEEAYFGPQEDIPVRKLIADQAIFQAHHELIRLVATFGAQTDPRWSGDNYTPHVTHTDKHELQEGDVVTLSAMQLFSRNAKGDKILHSQHALGDR